MTDTKIHSWDPDSFRAQFCQALSNMYRQEVPLYQDLIDIVNQVDDAVAQARQELNNRMDSDAYEIPSRHRVERHGAIRLGTPYELATIRRLFAIFGMHPVGYYDLTVVGFPLHATAFRPIDRESLEKHPFRVFTTLLRKDLLSSDIRLFAESVLSKRRLFTDRLLELIQEVEHRNYLSSSEADELLLEALKIFKWHSSATITFDDYRRLRTEHAIVADIVSFPSAHINHLTPRTLDIDLVQKTMVERGIPAKERIEGPPPRKCDILLRQTSFKAIEEQVYFPSGKGTSVAGTHTARFGEIEQRGAAVTRKGRQLYDQLLVKAYQNARNDPSKLDLSIQTTFEDFPDTWSELQSQGLIFVQFRLTPKGVEISKQGGCGDDGPKSILELVRDGILCYDPITYEDFLPFSAAGIFTSNLANNDADNSTMSKGEPDRSGFERDLGGVVADEFLLYEKMEQDSLEECRVALGIAEIIC